MHSLTRLGHESSMRRDLFALQLPDAAALSEADLSSLGHYVCLLAWDSSHEPVEVVSRVADIVLGSGCVYLCAWGRGCGRVHDIFDETIVGPDPDPDDDNDVMTSWHDAESLEEALWFFLTSTWPHEPHRDTCRVAVVVTVSGPEEWHETIAAALQSPEEFCERVLGSDGEEGA